MTVGAFTLTREGQNNLIDGDIDPDGDTIRAVLVDDAHTPAATDDTYSDISANECADGDYADQAATVTVSEPATGVTMVDMAQVNFGDTVTISARYFYLVKRAGGGLVAGDLILGYMDLNDGGSGNVSSVGSDFKVDAHANGLVRFQAA